ILRNYKASGFSGRLYGMPTLSRHLTMLLVRIWALVLTKDGSVIWDGQRRTGLLSAQRLLDARSRYRGTS
ncbi:MAG: hypothetical protein ACP5FY_08010, partial [Kosmotogaceae bacterium]